MRTILLLVGSNLFMTVAWYGHLKYRNETLWKVILVSWGMPSSNIACRFQRIGSATASFPFQVDEATGVDLRTGCRTR